MRLRTRVAGLWAALCSLLVCAASGCNRDYETVSSLTVPAKASGDVTVEFTLVDPLSQPTDAELMYSIDGGQTWHKATVKDPDALKSLSTSPDGIHYTTTWDSLADVGFRPEGALLTLAAKSSSSNTNKGSKTGSTQLYNLGAAADRVETHLIYFGPFDAEKIAIAETCDLVVLNQTDPTVTRDVIAEIQNGVDPDDPADDVIVLGYVFIGEDVRTIITNDDDMLLDPRFIGDASGPRVDPRGPDADGKSLKDMPLLGSPSVSGGYAPFYLDDNSVDNTGAGDGKPDRNPSTGACFVNAGAPSWFDYLDSTLLDDSVGIAVAGIRETLTTDYGRGFGCDGIFVSGIDTCAPNFFTDSNSPVQTEFEWTAPGYAAFLAKLRETYPDAVICQNRGLFFFNPSRPHFQVTTRPSIDFVTFESYRLNRSTTEDYNTYYFADNKYNVTPKLQAEANRPDGFQVLSLGYAEGPGISHDTLIGTSTDGFDTLVQDIIETQNLAGFRHYLTDAYGTIVNSFVRDNADFNDTTPPVWSNTFNYIPPYPTPSDPPYPRVGIQEVVPLVDAATLRWDVALDLNPVHYVIYYDSKPLVFDTNGMPTGKSVTRIAAQPTMGSGYDSGVGPNSYPHEMTITGLKKGTPHYFCVRAADSAGNEDRNQVVLSTQTVKKDINIQIDGKYNDWNEVAQVFKDASEFGPSAGPDWGEIKITNDDKNLYVYYSSDDPFNLDGSPTYTYSRTLIMIDIDRDPTTGWNFGTIGSDLLVAGEGLYTQAPWIWNTGKIGDITVAKTKNVTKVEFSIPLAVLDSVIGDTATKVYLVFLNDETWDLAPETAHIEYVIPR